MIKVIFSIFPLLFLTFAFCQEVEIYNGTEFKIQKKKRVDGFVENNENMLSLVTYSYKLFETADNRAELIVLDENLNFYGQFQISLPTSDEGKIVYRETKKFRNKLYLISRMFSKDNRMKYFASEMDGTTGTLKNHFQLLDHNLKESRIDRSDFFMSTDSSKMALLLEYTTKNSEQVKTGFKVFDEDLKTIWEADIILPTLDRDTYITDYIVDNKGNIHLVVRIALDKADRDKNQTNIRYKYALYSYFHESSTIKEYDLFLQNNYLTGLTLLEGKNNELIGSAFYSNDRVTGGLLGFLNFKLNLETYEIENSKMNEFTEDFKKNFLTERQIEKGRGIRNFSTRHIFATSDGGYAFVVEEFDYDVRTYTSYNPQTKTTEVRTSERWFFGDVAVFYIDQQGETKEIGIMKKHQIASATTSGYTGHGRNGYGTYHPARYWGISAMMKDDKIYLVYNENSKNLEDNPSKQYIAANIKKCTTVLTIIGPNAEYSRSPLFKSRDKSARYKSALIPRFHYTFNDSEQVIVGGMANYLRFMKVRIK